MKDCGFIYDRWKNIYCEHIVYVRWCIVAC